MVSGLVLFVVLVFSSFGVVVGINDGVKVAALTFNFVVPILLLLLWSGTTFFVVVVSSSCASAVADEEVRRMILGAAVDMLPWMLLVAMNRL